MILTITWVTIKVKPVQVKNNVSMIFPMIHQLFSATSHIYIGRKRDKTNNRMCQIKSIQNSVFDIRLNTVVFNGPSLETLLKIFELLKLMMLNNDALADRVTYNALFEILANAIDTHPEIEVVNDVSQYCDFLKLVQFQNSLHYY